MDAVTLPEPGIGLPTLAADALVDAGIFDALLDVLGRALKALPSALANWLGPELHTPANSGAPTVTFAESGPWNGVIFIEGDEASFWLLAKAGPDRRRRSAAAAPRPFGDPFGQSTPRWASEPRTQWDEPYGYEPPPWEAGPWRR